MKLFFENLLLVFVGVFSFLLFVMFVVKGGCS